MEETFLDSLDERTLQNKNLNIMPSIVAEAISLFFNGVLLATRSLVSATCDRFCVHIIVILLEMAK